ncbi:hypothetical protein IFM89_013679 [Coptis chinensis]|uniref:non-specific serine/threonine protein kinase n=1 Tax=Coptis chinensis TaxID=261450 RepID=A0A835IS47_9MAGN|nr:hypothetical protein IFM89_013679 [Coptis chinensis]
MRAYLLLIHKLLLSLTLISSLLSPTHFTSFGSQTNPKLVITEVNALKAIATKLGKRGWDFTVDPCSNKGNWTPITIPKGFENLIECDCSFKKNSTCHVTKIWLKAQNLSGFLPPELNKLRFLKSLDLGRNILSGSMPSEWATMQLEELSVMGNRLSGPFPKVLSSIITLKNLSIEGNHFSGILPAELGNLINLEKLVISSNQFTGQLPKRLANLINLTDLRVSDNNISGRVPDFIRNWTQMERLHIQGSSLEGPIPAGISALTSLSDLRITDLKGTGFDFPQLSTMKSMKTLILRNCMIHGSIPKYIGELEKLKNLDLSFNNLTGEIPLSFANLVKVDFIYLTRNMLTGAIPAWVLGRNKNVYGMFLITISRGKALVQENVLMGMLTCWRAISQQKISCKILFPLLFKSKVHSCLKENFPCDSSKKIYSLNINCGGNEVSVNSVSKYEADTEQTGASKFYYGPDRTGHLAAQGASWTMILITDVYVERNTSVISNVSGPISELYMTARVSPLSLTYYGLCLGSGNYTVKLYFAKLFFKMTVHLEALGGVYLMFTFR